MAMVLDAFVGVAFEKLSALLQEKACMILGVRDELNKLLRKLQRLKIFLEDAESKSIQEPSIRSWLGELKDVMYDADDVIDICRIQGTELLEGHQPSTSTKSVRNCFPLMSCFCGTKFRYEIAEQIKKLNERLKEIEDNKPPRLEVHNTMRSNSINNRQTSPVMAESDYVGEDVEKAAQYLVTSLIEDSQSRTKCRVWGIVGMGGIGKTTLATKVYNHPSTVGHFTVRIWVCVSQTFSETDILKQIIQGAGGFCGETSSKSQLHSLLISSLSKKFLIVLDDVWSTGIWEDSLRGPLEECGAPSGRVVVTTRDLAIATNMRATIHNVEKMDQDDGWVLLCKKVFGDDGREEEMSGLKDIGLQIVKKCDGLPLAIKVIAGVLRSTGASREDWEKLLRNHAWSMDQLPEELRGALYLSYADLPSYLKQCFLYCSLFKEGYYIHKENLIHYWVAEGFIPNDKDEDDALIEDIAEEYYNQLIRRHLLQYANKKVCRMHDLLRSLAKFLIEDENICIDSDAAQGTLQGRLLNPLRSVRRLSFANRSEMTTSFFYNIKENTRGLRSLLWFGKGNMQTLMDGDVLVKIPQSLRVLDLSRLKIKKLPNSMGNLVHLRYLNLNGTSINKLPKSIGNLVHLRYLNLNGTSIGKLPESIGNLVHLTYLDLSYARIHELPESIGNLVHLTYLDLSCTRIHELPESIGNFVNLQVLCLAACANLHYLPYEITQLSNLRRLFVRGAPLEYLPKGIAQLKQLNYLEWFVVGDVHSLNKACKIEELQPLSKLRELSINKLERVRVTTGTSLLTNKKLLRTLTLKFSIENYPGEYGFEYGETEINAMEELCPPSNLEKLSIENYPGCIFPRWIPLYNGFSRLESVSLNYCKSCTQLPPLGQLPQLKRLEICGAESIVSVGPEFFFGGTSATGEGAFPKLESLQFSFMSKWEELVLEYDECVHKGKLLPCLEYLHLQMCPKLRSLPSGLQHATSLQWLTISDVDCIQEVKNLPSLIKELEVSDCACLQEIQPLPLLQTLHINNCPQLTRVSDVDSLQELRLSLDEETERLPNWLLELALERQQRKANPDFELQLKCSSIQLQRCREGGEYWHIIKQFPRVHITIERDEVTSESLTIVNDIQVIDVM